MNHMSLRDRLSIVLDHISGEWLARSPIDPRNVLDSALEPAQTADTLILMFRQNNPFFAAALEEGYDEEPVHELFGGFGYGLAVKVGEQAYETDGALYVVEGTADSLDG